MTRSFNLVAHNDSDAEDFRMTNDNSISVHFFDYTYILFSCKKKDKHFFYFYRFHHKMRNVNICRSASMDRKKIILVIMTKHKIMVK